MTESHRLDQSLPELIQFCKVSPVPTSALSYIYPRVRFLTDNQALSISLLPIADLFRITRVFLVNKDQEIRTTSLRIYRYLTTTENSFDLLKSTKIEHFLVRSFEVEGKSQERIEACKLIRKWLEAAPSTFPKGLCNALVALSEAENDEFKEFGLEAIRLLSVSNPTLVAWSGGIRVLISALMDIRCSQELSENIIYTICYLLNEEETRGCLKNGKDLMRLLSVFTDDNPVMKENDLEISIKLARKTITLMSRSWSGLIFLASSGFESVINTLLHPSKSIIKEGILDTVADMLNISVEFGARSYNLLNNYLALMINALLHCGLYKALEYLLTSTNARISGRALKLLNTLAKLSSELLPNAPTLPISSTLGRLSKPAENSDYLPSNNSQNILKTSINFLTSNSQVLNPPKLLFTSICNQYLCNSIDDLLFYNLLLKSQVGKETAKWQWEDISSIISSLISTSERRTSQQTQKFLQLLTGYFSPSKGQFISLAWKPENFIIAQTGSALVDLLLEEKELRHFLTAAFSESFFVVRRSFAEEMVDAVNLELEFLKKQKDPMARIFSPIALRSTMAKEYFKWLGTMLNSGFGRKILKSLGLIQKFFELAEIEHLANTLLPVLDYKQQICQQFLSFCLQSKCKSIKHKALAQLQAIFRAGLFDLSWAIWGIVNLLYIQDDETVTFSLSVLNDLCQYKENLKELISTRPQTLMKLGKLEENCLRKFLTTRQGVSYLSELGYINTELELWHNRKNIEYARNIEEQIEQGLSTQKKNFALVLSTPNIFLNYGRIQTSWIASLPLIINVEYNSEYLLKDGILEVTNGEIFVGCYFFEYFMKPGCTVSASMQLADCFIDVKGNLINEPSWVLCRNDAKQLVKSNNSWDIENEGVIFTFSADQVQVKLESIHYRVQLLPTSISTMHIPAHFFGELVKTEDGLKILVESKYIEEYTEKLMENYSIIQKRSWLWAIGHVGASSSGAEYLIKIRGIEKIIKIAEKSNILSLRGTAIQTLSLISRCQLGRYELAKYSWLSSSSGHNSICIPQSTLSIFWLTQADYQSNYLSHCETFEKALENLPLTPEQNQIYTHICRLGGVLDKTPSENYLRDLRISSPISFQNLNLFQAVMLTISIYSFKLPVRRMIHKLLERVNRIEDLQGLDLVTYI